jgi:hypothetical protein
LNCYYIKNGNSYYGDADAINKIVATKESFTKYCEDIEARKAYDGQYVCYNVIQIKLNSFMETT